MITYTVILLKYNAFFFFADTDMEFQFVFPDGTFQVQDNPPYSIVHQGNMNDIPLTLNRQDSHNPPKWPVLPMLQYTNIDTIDTMLPKIQLTDLGYGLLKLVRKSA